MCYSNNILNKWPGNNTMNKEDLTYPQNSDHWTDYQGHSFPSEFEMFFFSLFQYFAHATFFFFFLIIKEKVSICFHCWKFGSAVVRPAVLLY